MRVVRCAVLTGLGMLAVAGSVQAQQWPSAPVRVVVNIAPGGAADRTARLLAPRLSEALGQPMVVENRPGGEGFIGAEAVARTPADGHTILFAAGSGMMIAPHLVRRTDFDPVKELVPVAPVVRVTMFLVTHPSVPVGSLAEFIDYARKNPGKLNYGSAGTGSALHIAGEVLKREARIDITHVPYKGAGPALKDLLGGQVQAMFDPGIALEHVKAGKLRLHAVTAERRHPDFPDTPTISESGYRGIDGGPYFGYYVPKGTPGAVVQRFNAEVTKVLQDPEVRKRLEGTGLEVAQPMAPEAFARYVGTESTRYAKLLPELGIRGE